MAFLELNGWTIPTAKGGQVSNVDVGGTDRALNATMLIQRVKSKRRWQFETKPMQQADAIALMNVVLGKGDQLRFNTTSTAVSTPTAAELASDKGVAATTSDDIIFESNFAADGSQVEYLTAYPSTTEKIAVAGRSAFFASPAYTNILAAADRDCEEATSWNDYGGSSTITREDTDNYWQGSKSVKCVTVGPVTTGGAETTAFNATGGTAYVAMVYVKVEADRVGEELLMWFEDPTTNSYETFTPTSADVGKWIRLWVLHTVDGVGTKSCKIAVRDLGGDNVGTYYIDGATVYAGTQPTYWADGAGAAADLAYPADLLSDLSGSWSINVWGQIRNNNPSGNQFFISCRTTTANISHGVAFYANTAGTLRAVIWDSNGNVANTSTLSASAGTIYQSDLLSLVYDKPNATIYVYVDGVQIDSSAVVVTPSFDLSQTAHDVYVGNYYSGGFNKHNRINQVSFWPFAAPASMLVSMAANPQSASMPAVLATGDFTEDSSVNVLGRVARSSFVGIDRSGTWESNNVIVKFELVEV